MTQMISRVILRGYVTIRVLDGKSGRELYRLEDHNLVCEGAQTAMAKLLAPASQAEQDANQLWSIGAGDSTTAPTVSDTDLVGTKTYRKVCDSVTSNAGGVPGLVEAVVTFTAGEGNVLSTGEYFTEVGLFSRGDSDTVPPSAKQTGAELYSRQLHAPIHKDGTIALEYTWRYEIALS